MNPQNQFFSKPLVTCANGETDAELQDRVRRIVPASGVSFRSGRMFLNGAAIRQLAQAVLDGKIEGNVDQALFIMDQISKGALKPGSYLSLGAARKICKAIIEGREKDDVHKAREYLAFLNRKYPNH